MNSSKDYRDKLLYAHFDFHKRWFMKDEFENIKNIFKDRRGVFNLFKNKAIGLSISTEHDLYSVLDMF